MATVTPTPGSVPRNRNFLGFRRGFSGHPIQISVLFSVPTWKTVSCPLRPQPGHGGLRRHQGSLGSCPRTIDKTAATWSLFFGFSPWGPATAASLAHGQIREQLHTEGYWTGVPREGGLVARTGTNSPGNWAPEVFVLLHSCSGNLNPRSLPEVSHVRILHMLDFSIHSK